MRIVQDNLTEIVNIKKSFAADIKMAAPMESAIENYVKGFEDSAAKLIVQGNVDAFFSMKY